MGLFTRKPKRLGWGRAAVETVYAGEPLAELLSAIEITADVFGNPVTSRLADELIPGKFAGPRTAVNSLRREGISAIPAIPAIAAWARSCIGKIPDDNAGYGVRESLFTLGDLRKIILGQGRGGSDAIRPALETFAGFLDGEVEDIARLLITTPNGRADRGAISYLRSSRGQIKASMDALGEFLDNHPGETGDGDFDYARNDAMYALQDLASRLRAQTPATPQPDAQVPTIAEVSLDSEDHNNIDDDDDDDDVDDDIHFPSRRQRLSPQQRDVVSELLIEAAQHDSEPMVRAQALDALNPHTGAAEPLVALARTCLTDDAPAVRSAAVRLLARLLA